MKRDTQHASNHEMVFAALRSSNKPMTAYNLLGRLRPRGITAPTTVYRALERLIEAGRIHRLESLNAFVVCGHPHHDTIAMFSICSRCGGTEEIVEPKLQSGIAALAERSGFKLNHAVLEMHGRCKACAGAARQRN